MLTRAGLALVVSAFLGLSTGCDGPAPEPPPSLLSEAEQLRIAETHSRLAPSPSPAAQPAAALSPQGLSPLDGRPYQLKVPRGYDATKPTPLLVMLHGFSASGPLEELYLNFSALADKRTFLYAYPDGTQNPLGLRFWNAMEWCCNFFGSPVDDVAYVSAVIDDMAKKYNVDKKRIFVVGHSNGGFMAHRVGCELSDKVAGIVSLAGMQFNDPTRCNPKQPIAVLQVHGTLDVVISYIGSLNYPSAKSTLAIWANRNRCTGRLTYGGENRDLELVIPGAETTVESYTGCPAQGPVELWSIQGGSHLPAFTSFWTGQVYDYLMAHPKP